MLIGMDDMVVDAKDQIKMLRHFLQIQRDMEVEMRELSEKINTDTYRYTLLQIFVLGIIN